MIGYYNYTVILTYLSLISASVGIFISLHGNGHPYIGTFFLMFCGLCDAFDGRVAKTKKNRTPLEKEFGVQIDSLSDLVAFGVLPACIGYAMLSLYPKVPELGRIIAKEETQNAWLVFLLIAVMTLYILAALIRLAYFNATEDERNERIKKGEQVYYAGVPVTSASLVFPFVMLLQYFLVYDLTLIYFLVMTLLGVLFITKVRIPKPGTKMVLVFVIIGIIEAVVLLVFKNGLKVH